MKTKLIPLFFLLYCSCENIARFETPQPEGQRDERSVPSKLTGTFRSLNDSSVLQVTKQQIVKTIDWKFNGTISDLDSAVRTGIKGDTTFTDETEISPVTYKVRGDSVFASSKLIDTLFNFSRGDKLRKLKGYYLINQQTASGGWVVMKIGITKYGLLIGHISNQGDLDKLRELTNSQTDTVYNFRPTKLQMKEFIKDQGFSDEERFIKVQ
jgi:hypothetical protein